MEICLQAMAFTLHRHPYILHMFSRFACQTPLGCMRIASLQLLASQGEKVANRFPRKKVYYVSFISTERERKTKQNKKGRRGTILLAKWKNQRWKNKVNLKTKPCGTAPRKDSPCYCPTLSSATLPLPQAMLLKGS